MSEPTNDTTRTPSEACAAALHISTRVLYGRVKAGATSAEVAGQILAITDLLVKLTELLDEHPVDASPRPIAPERTAAPVPRRAADWAEVETDARALVQRLRAAGGLDGGVLTTAGYLAAAIDRIDDLAADHATIERLTRDEPIVVPDPPIVLALPGERYSFAGRRYGVQRNVDGTIVAVDLGVDHPGEALVTWVAAEVLGSHSLGIRLRLVRR